MTPRRSTRQANALAMFRSSTSTRAGDKELKEELDREARARRAAGHVDPGSVRFRIRSGVERTNARLKDEFGGRHVRVRGHAKVACHLMFGILALTVDQLIRLAAP